MFGTLDIIHSEGSGELFSLDLPVVRFGRGKNNEIKLRDPYVAREHGRFICDSSGCSVLDPGSVNGISVNGAKISPNTPVLLNDYDIITVGNVSMTYRAP